jgi:hypothetical protein
MWRLITPLVLIFAFLFAASPHAAEKSRLEAFFASLPPMSEKDRTDFDKAVQSMYFEDCDCLRFLHRGVVRKFMLPLSDADRLIITEGFRRKLIIAVTGDRKS